MTKSGHRGVRYRVLGLCVRPLCPECGGLLVHRSCCVECPLCGFSFCGG